MSFHYEIQDFIVIFTIDYAPSNSITNQTLQGLEETLDRVRNEEELKGLVITGNGRILDRKSTRLNSSHGYISYAVFCLKKKKSKRNS